MPLPVRSAICQYQWNLFETFEQLWEITRGTLLLNISRAVPSKTRRRFLRFIYKTLKQSGAPVELSTQFAPHSQCIWFSFYFALFCTLSYLIAFALPHSSRWNGKRSHNETYPNKALRDQPIYWGTAALLTSFVCLKRLAVKVTTARCHPQIHNFLCPDVTRTTKALHSIICSFIFDWRRILASWSILPGQLRWCVWQIKAQINCQVYAASCINSAKHSHVPLDYHYIHIFHTFLKASTSFSQKKNC